MKYTIEIPTLETLDTLTATAHRKAQAWMLEIISNKMEHCASYGEESYTLGLEVCPYNVNQADVNEVQNTLREMGYMTTHYPRRQELFVDWSMKGRKELAELKKNNACWKFPTKKEMEQRRAELEKILNKGA